MPFAIQTLDILSQEAILVHLFLYMITASSSVTYLARNNCLSTSSDPRPFLLMQCHFQHRSKPVLPPVRRTDTLRVRMRLNMRPRSRQPGRNRQD